MVSIEKGGTNHENTRRLINKLPRMKHAWEGKKMSARITSKNIKMSN